MSTAWWQQPQYGGSGGSDSPNPGGVQSLRQRYGGNASTYQDAEDDPPVYWGMKPGETDPSEFGYNPQPNTKSTSKSYAEFYALSDAELRRVQTAAKAAGAYGKDEPPWGDYDEQTRKFWMAMVDRSAGFYAAGKSVSPWDAMDKAAKAGSASGVGPTKQPLVVKPSNPSDIREGVKAAAYDKLGRGLTKKELNEWVAVYQGLEENYQRAVYAAEGSGLPGGPGGTVPEAPSLHSFANERIEEMYPGETGAHRLAVVGENFFNLLRGG